ncbi:GATA-binding factor C [Papilio xuthus]|uniref:GATA-binding factor C n=1 Tax=Papilio xuthus TaxID=66420 RepID=A0A194Q826_PAPXU|nr:GATA-binding factor C [Papilio xuthus]
MWRDGAITGIIHTRYRAAIAGGIVREGRLPWPLAKPRSMCTLPNVTPSIDYCRTLSGGSGQVCRPHFHTPLHPWLDSKALGGGAWGGGFQQDGAQADKPLSPAQHHHPHPLFSFPPTPPKDSTPDSVAAAALGQQDYQAAVAHATAMSVAFMQQQQELPLCGDVKPMMGAPPSKQREGAQPDSCPQDASQPSGEYNAQYNAAGGDYYSYQGKGYSQQQSKPRPNKTRTSAGEFARSSLHSPRPL